MAYLRTFCLFICVVLFYVTTDVVHSKLVYHPEIRRLTSQHKLVATWDEAKAHCESEGATLASPTDADMVAYMRSVIRFNRHTTPYFIGIKAIHHGDLQFLSEEGVALEDLPEALDMVEQLDPRNGDCLSMDGHTIRVVQCWTRLPYICYSNTTTTSEVPTTAAATTPTPKHEAVYCGEGYRLSKTGSYYKVHEAPANWDLANLTCATEGAYLAILNSLDEARQVKYAVFPIGIIRPHAWVGVQYIKEINEWRTIHGDPLTNLFHDFASPRSNTVFECGAMKFDKRLTDWPCSDEHPFVCEKDTCV